MSAGEPRTSRGVVIGNVFDKYGSRNPIVRRMMDGFDRGLDELLAAAGPGIASVLEVGCGEGHVTRKLVNRFPQARVMGSDFAPEIIATARAAHPDLRFEVRSVYELGAAGERYDLVVACEVMEHLDDPARALREMAAIADRAVLVTVPREPVWRALNLARGRYVGALGNTPGHVQHWSRSAFLELVGRELDVIATRSPLPWTQAVGRPRRRG